MPRTKEAIATLRGFCKHESKQKRDGVETGDALFAKGILAAIRWMTEEDSPVPYAELVEDMPEDGGWEQASNIILAQHVPAGHPLHAVEAARTAPAPNLPQFVPQIMEPGTLPPEDRKPLELPGSVTQAMKDHPWLAEYAKDISYMQEGTPVTDANAVVVGQGLNDAPLLGGGGDY